MYSFRTIRNSIRDAKPSTQFPLGIALTNEQRQALRTAPHLQALLGELRIEAERAQTEPVPVLPFRRFQEFETSGEREGYQQPYFERRRRLLGLVMVSVLDETDAYLPVIEDMIWAICDEYTWCVPAHLPLGVEANRANWVPPEQQIDLFGAETAYALAETLWLLGDRLHPWIAYRVRREVDRRVFHIAYSPRHFGWEGAAHNWAAVIGGNLGMAALLLEQDRERLAGMVERVVRMLESFLEGYGADGACPEGIKYWQYGFGHYAYFAEMLRAFTDGALDLLQGEKIHNIAAFPARISLSDGCYVSYSDAVLRDELPSGLVSRLTMHTGAPPPTLPAVASLYNGRHWGHITRDVFWTDPDVLQRPTGEATVVLPDVAWVLDRRRAGNTMIGFSAKGGHNDEPHNHNDLGHFILHIGGDDLLADLGAPRYTRDYFRGDRYSFLHAASEGHSVPIIAGHPQGAGHEHAAVVLDAASTVDGLRCTLDLTRAYDVPQLHRFTRAFVWRVNTAASQAALELTDVFESSEPLGVLEEVFISLHEPELLPSTVVWRGEHGSVTLRYDTEQLTPHVETIATTERHGQPLTVYRLRLHSQPAETYVCHRLTFLCQV
jgi:hypothetical protein